MLLRTRNLAENSRVDVVAQNYMDKIGATDRDLVILEPYSIGDAYHTLCLLREFRMKYAKPETRLFFLCQQRAAPLVNLFHIAERCVVIPSDDFLYEMFANRFPLSMGLPIVTAPDMHAHGWLGRLVGGGLLSPLMAKRLILGLDSNSALHHAVINDDLKNRAANLAKEYGVEPGKSLLIFNHANTCAPLDVEAYRGAVAAFPGPVFTDMVENSILIPGTKPIKIPLDLVIPMAELCGHTLALRSGIVDILANARTKLATIYPRAADMRDFVADKVAAAKTMRTALTLAQIGLSAPGFERTIKLDDADTTTSAAEKIQSAFAP